MQSVYSYYCSKFRHLPTMMSELVVRRLDDPSNERPRANGPLLQTRGSSSETGTRRPRTLIAARKDGALMEPGGRNRCQPVANATDRETADLRESRCRRLVRRGTADALPDDREVNHEETRPLGARTASSAGSLAARELFRG